MACLFAVLVNWQLSLYLSFVQPLSILNKTCLKTTPTLNFPIGLMISARNNSNFFTLISLEHCLQQLQLFHRNVWNRQTNTITLKICTIDLYKNFTPTVSAFLPTSLTLTNTHSRQMFQNCLHYWHTAKSHYFPYYFINCTAVCHITAKTHMCSQSSQWLHFFK